MKRLTTGDGVLLLLLGLLCFQQEVLVTSAARFIREPSNLTVVAGTREATLQCFIRNSRGPAQWSKDGFTIGFLKNGFGSPNSVFANYNLEKSDNPENYNLRIHNVTIADDAIYFCQVLVDKIRSRNVRLNVLVPPKLLTITPTDERGLITVMENQPITIKCDALESKPASGISWQVGDSEVFRPVVNRSIPGTKLWSSSSSFTMTPSKAHNGTLVRCMASNPALSTGVVIQSRAFNVLYPPGQPITEGYSGEDLVAGQNLSLTCISYGGNPLATINWKLGKDDIPAVRTLTSGDRVISVIHQLLQAKHNGKKVTCSVDSPALSAPLSTSVVLKVLYSPDNVAVYQNPSNGVFENSSVSLTCHTTKSNPKPSLSWYRGGLPITEGGNDVSISRLDLTFRAQSTLTVARASRHDAKMSFTCRASIRRLGFETEASTKIDINYPPRAIQVRVYHLGSTVSKNGDTTGKKNVPILRSGQTVQLKCFVIGGHPAPVLRWSRNGQPLTKLSGLDTKQIDPNQVIECGRDDVTCSVLELTLRSSDDLARFECRASHVASRLPMREAVVLQVIFPPSDLRITQFPSTLVSGGRMSLTCETERSNPASSISWYRDDKPIVTTRMEAPGTQAVVTTYSRPATDGSGYITHSQLYLTPTVQFDESKITCRATNRGAEKSVDKTRTLDVQFAPFFAPTRLRFNVTEGSRSLAVRIPIRANPDNVTYRWSRYLPVADGAVLLAPLARVRKHRWSAQQGELLISDVRRGDAGLYRVEARNLRGSAAINVTIDVLYAPEILGVTGPEEVTEGVNVVLSCRVTSHPLLRTQISWIKEVSNPFRLKYDITSDGVVSKLSLRNVTSHDRGLYRCVASNGIGNPGVDTVSLRVKFRAAIDRSLSTIKVARPPHGGVKMSAVLVCRAAGNPRLTFSWFDESGEAVVGGRSDSLETGYMIDVTSLGGDVYASKLFINTRAVHTDDLEATFRCRVVNSLGGDSIEMKLIPRGIPDRPSEITVTNVTYEAVTVTWSPGFDGGAPQTFLLEYRKTNGDLLDCGTRTRESWSRINVPHSRSSQLLEGLAEGTAYQICLLSFNTFGRSTWVPVTQIKTAENQADSTNLAGAGLPTNYILIIALSSGVVLVIVALIAVVLIRRCVQNIRYKPKSINTESDNLPTPNGSLTGSEQDDSSPAVDGRQVSSRRSDTSKGIYNVSGGNDADVNHERGSLSRAARSSRATSCSSLLHEDVINSEFYARCGVTQIPYYPESPHDLTHVSPRQVNSVAHDLDSQYDRRAMASLSTFEHSTPMDNCEHSINWDTCVRCIEENVQEQQASGRFCNILRHGSDLTGQRYHTLAMQPSNKRASVSHVNYSTLHSHTPSYDPQIRAPGHWDVPASQNQRVISCKGSMPRSYSSSSFTVTPRSETRFQLQPLLGKSDSHSESFYAVNVDGNTRRYAPEYPNDSGLYVLGLDSGVKSSDSVPPLSMRKAEVPPGVQSGALAGGRNSWISSSSSTSDYCSQRSGNREKSMSAEFKREDQSRLDSIDVLGGQGSEFPSEQSSRMSVSSSASSTRALIPAKIFTLPEFDEERLDSTHRHGNLEKESKKDPTDLTPPFIFQDGDQDNLIGRHLPNKSNADAAESKKSVFIGVDSDGTLFV